tara:strand:+ start:59 stop:343 length:285 start_codon:yes stop_codon:yes gene_type:complete
MKLTKIRAGRYLASFNINGVTELALVEKDIDGTWAINGCIGWNTDFSDGGFSTLRFTKQCLAFYIKDQATQDANKTYSEPSEDHKAFVKGMLSN